MHCPNCGGYMVGDGYTERVHCERMSIFDEEVRGEPDASPVFCNPEPGDREPHFPPTL